MKQQAVQTMAVRYQYQTVEVKGGFWTGNANPKKMTEVMNTWAASGWEVVNVACYVRTLLIFFNRWSALITFRARV